MGDWLVPVGRSWREGVSFLRIAASDEGAPHCGPTGCGASSPTGVALGGVVLIDGDLADIG